MSVATTTMTSRDKTRLRSEKIVIPQKPSSLKLPAYLSPRSSGHCRLHRQEHRGEVSSSRWGVGLMGALCGYVAGAGLPRWTVAESVLNLAREMSFSLGSCGCLDVAFCDILFEFNFQDDNPLTCFKDVVECLQPCSERCHPVWVENSPKDHLQSSKCAHFCLLQCHSRHFLTPPVSWKITDEFNLPSLLVYLNFLYIKVQSYTLNMIVFPEASTSLLEIIYSVLKITDLVFQIAWQKRSRPQMVEFGSAGPLHSEHHL